ncbi:hypothetical protein CLOP_g10007 [Closterium sp. NIES-67]|nr:hypothetical protein CLOP_g10007 [Closterium sp. NIES-67]
MVSSRRAVLPEGSRVACLASWDNLYHAGEVVTTRRAAGRDGKGAGLAAGSVAAGPEAVGSAAAGAALARKGADFVDASSVEYYIHYVEYNKRLDEWVGESRVEPWTTMDAPMHEHEHAYGHEHSHDYDFKHDHMHDHTHKHDRTHKYDHTHKHDHHHENEQKPLQSHMQEHHADVDAKRRADLAADVDTKAHSPAAVGPKRRRLDAPGAAAAAPGWQEGILEAPTKLDSRAAAGVKEEPDSGGGGGGVGSGCGSGRRDRDGAEDKGREGRLKEGGGGNAAEDAAALERQMRVKNVETVEIGEHEIDTWYFSPYPPHLTKSGRLFICDACLKYSNSPTAYERHLAKCRQIHPPGEEVYRCRLLPPNPAAPPPHLPINLSLGATGLAESTVAAVSGRGTYCGEFDAHEEKNEAKAAGAAAAGGGGTMGADGGGGGAAAAAGGTMGADGGAGGTTGTGLEKQAADVAGTEDGREILRHEKPGAGLGGCCSRGSGWEGRAAGERAGCISQRVHGCRGTG